MTALSPERVAVLGAGNIGAALIGGMLKAGVTTPDRLRATVRTEEHAADLARKYGITVTAGENARAVESADLVILAVKPTTLPSVLGEIRAALHTGQLLISLAAAFPIALIERLIDRPGLAVARAMPNIPVVVDEGATGIATNASATASHKALVESVFRPVGVVCFVDEDLLHAVTAMSGSGPAYIYMVIEGLVAAGLKMGLSHAVSTRLAEQTVLGAAKLVRETGLHPAILRDQVITPGGVTISAVHELEKHGLRSMLISAIETATHHSRHLTKTLLAKFDTDS